MCALDYDRYLGSLRYVRKGDYVLADDHNLKKLCLYAARDWLLKICERYGVDPKYVYELDPYLSKIRTVRSGDIIEPEDHNSIVDALKKLREILEKIETAVAKEGWEEGYEAGYEEGVSSVMPVRQTNTLSTVASGTWAYGKAISIKPLELLPIPLLPTGKTVVMLEERPFNTVHISVLNT